MIIWEMAFAGIGGNMKLNALIFCIFMVALTMVGVYLITWSAELEHSARAECKEMGGVLLTDRGIPVVCVQSTDVLKEY